MNIDESHYFPIGAGFTIIYNLHSRCTITQLHCHNSYEILVPFNDGIKCYVSDQVYHVKKGDVFIFPPCVPHKVDPCSNTLYERYVLYFKAEYMDSFSPLAEKLLSRFSSQSVYDAPYVHLDEEQIASLIALIKKTQYYINSPGYAQEIYIKHTFFEILLLLSKHSYTQNINPQACLGIHYFKIKDVTPYIYCNLSEDLSLDHLTKRFYMSKTYLNNMFKLHTGYTVNQYIITIRIATAKKLLQEGMPVSHVYEKVGFKNYSHFIRTFTKVTGISPKQYALTSELKTHSSSDFIASKH